MFFFFFLGGGGGGGGGGYLCVCMCVCVCACVFVWLGPLRVTQLHYNSSRIARMPGHASQCVTVLTDASQVKMHKN